MNILLFFISALLSVIFALVALKKDSAVLIAWIALQGVMANLFVLKQITLFTLHPTASDVFMIGSLLALNLLREKHGPIDGMKQCKTAIFASFLCMIFFCIMSQIHLLYEPSPIDRFHAAFAQILTPNPRILLASLGVFFSIQMFDLYFYNFLRSKTNTPIILVNGFSLAVSQLLDTVLFTFLGLYGQMSHLTHIIIVSYAIKLIAILTMVPLARLMIHGTNQAMNNGINNDINKDNREKS